jgi:putative transposase
MKDYKSLSHSVWDCKYHIVWIPKGRKKKLSGEVATYLGGIFHELARQREVQYEY